MADEIGEIDLTPQSEASKTASNYITDVNNDGIFVHQTDMYMNGTTPSENTSYGVHITDVIKIIRAGIDRLQIAADNIRIGAVNAAHAIISASGLEVFSWDSQNSESKSLAFFGQDRNGESYSRLGSDADNHVTVDSDGIYGWANGSDLGFALQMSSNNDPQFFLGNTNLSGNETIRVAGSFEIYTYDQSNNSHILSKSYTMTKVDISSSYSSSLYDRDTNNKLYKAYKLSVEYSNNLTTYYVYSADETELIYTILALFLDTSSTRTGLSQNSYVAPAYYLDDAYYEMAWYSGPVASENEITSQKLNKVINVDAVLQPQSVTIEGLPGLLISKEKTILGNYAYANHQSADDTTIFAIGDGTDNTHRSEIFSIDSDSTVLVGRDDQSHLKLDYHSLQLVDKEGNVYFHVSDLRDAEGYLTETFKGDGSTTTFTVTYGVSSQSVTSVEVDGIATSYTRNYETFIFEDAPANNAQISIRYLPSSPTILKGITFGSRNSGSFIGGYSSAFGYQVTANANYSHAEGYRTIAKSIVQTYGTRVIFSSSNHAEGIETIASGHAAHSEGTETKASGMFSHAEGENTQASGNRSHAEGDHTLAIGDSSHSQGVYTNANVKGQDASGTFNVMDGEVITETFTADGITTRFTLNNSNALATDFTIDGNYANGYKTYSSNGKIVFEFIVPAFPGSITYSKNGVMSTSSPVFMNKVRIYETGISDDVSSISISAPNKKIAIEGNELIFDTPPSDGSEISITYIISTHPTLNTDYGAYAAIIGNGQSEYKRSNALAVRWDGLIDVGGTAQSDGTPNYDAQTAYPTFVYDTKPANSDPPVLPCFVLNKADLSLWYYD